MKSTDIFISDRWSEAAGHARRVFRDLTAA